MDAAKIAAVLGSLSPYRHSRSSKYVFLGKTTTVRTEFSVTDSNQPSGCVSSATSLESEDAGSG
jgi:hypothetical protein